MVCFQVGTIERKTNMQLPWNDYQSDLSIQDALESALNGEDGGSQLASSKSFTDDFELEGLDLWSVESRYKQFFADTAVEISAALGQPTFSGAMPAAMEWMDKLEVDHDSVQLWVWTKAHAYVYLRYDWGDKDLPVAVLLGKRSADA